MFFFGSPHTFFIRVFAVAVFGKIEEKVFLQFLAFYFFVVAVGFCVMHSS
jgi:hypothetical protein